jgi:hypothetical protein
MKSCTETGLTPEDTPSSFVDHLNLFLIYIHFHPILLNKMTFKSPLKFMNLFVVMQKVEIISFYP